MPKQLPLSIRQNNPGNIRPGKSAWVGQIGVGSGFCIFDTMEHGIRALAKNLIAYQDRYGIDSVREAITRWAPGNENNTTAYIAYVCHVLGVNQDDTLNFHEPNTLFWMVTAIGEEESGHDAFTDAVSDLQINTGVNMALLS